MYTAHTRVCDRTNALYNILYTERERDEESAAIIYYSTSAPRIWAGKDCEGAMRPYYYIIVISRRRAVRREKDGGRLQKWTHDRMNNRSNIITSLCYKYMCNIRNGKYVYRKSGRSIYYTFPGRGICIHPGFGKEG